MIFTFDDVTEISEPKWAEAKSGEIRRNKLARAGTQSQRVEDKVVGV